MGELGVFHGSPDWQKDSVGGGGRSKGLTVWRGCFNELISKSWRMKEWEEGEQGAGKCVPTF